MKGQFRVIYSGPMTDFVGDSGTAEEDDDFPGRLRILLDCGFSLRAVRPSDAVAFGGILV